MRASEIYLVTPDLLLASKEDVDRAAEQLGCRLPQGYAEYVMRFGDGTLNGLVYVWPPGVILERREECQAAWREFGELWPWDDPESQVTQERILGSLPVGDTNMGDMLCFHPEDPDTVLVVPHDLEMTFAIGAGLDAALDWIFSSGALTQPGPIAEFHAHVPTRSVSFKDAGSTLNAIRDSVAAIEGAGPVQQFHSDWATVYFPDVKGLVRIHEIRDGSVGVLLNYQLDVPDGDAMQVQLELSRAGLRYETSW